MPFVFLLVGLVMLVIGVRGEQARAVKLLKSEFTGSNSFIQWIIAISVVGGLGYIKPLKPISDAFLFLLLLVMIVANQNRNGLFAKIEDALQNSTASTPPNPNTQTKSGVGSLGDIIGGFGGNIGNNPSDFNNSSDPIGSLIDSLAPSAGDILPVVLPALL